MSELDDLEIHEQSGMGLHGVSFSNIREHARRGMRTMHDRSAEAARRKRFLDSSRRAQPSLPQFKCLRDD